MSLAAVKALTFDVFGTVVDWRGSLIRECTEFGAARGISVDWARFADAWRGGYRPSMDRVARGELPWTNIDTLHRMILDGLLDEFGIAGLSESDKDHLNRAWHRLQP
jgi:2-haloacid dehalogenase